MALSTGIDLIAAERQRQERVLGYSVRHDQEHVEEELARAAAVYALPPIFRTHLERECRVWYPWPGDWDFRGNTNRIRELQKAGALIAAEIDRLIAIDFIAKAQA